jgi:flagellin
MALVIQSNITSIQSQSSLRLNQRSLDTAMSRLSTGLRINSAKDDAAGSAIGQRMSTQVRGLDQAVRNLNDGINLLQTADGGLHSITDMLQRMRELAVQSVNDTLNDEQRGYLQIEFDQLRSEIINVTQTTTWNQKNLLDGSFINQQIQVGANRQDILALSIPSLGAVAEEHPSPTWTTMTASTGSAYINAMALGPDGYLYATGEANGVIDGQQAGQEDFLLSKYSTDGQRIWSKLLGAGIGVDVPRAIAIAEDGSIYVAGSTNGSLSNPTSQTDRIHDIMVAKFSPNGTLLGAAQVGTTDDDRAFGLTIGKDGAVYLTGTTTGSLDGTSPAGGDVVFSELGDAFVMKMDDGLQVQWTRQLTGTCAGNGIQVGADGSLYLVGVMNGTVNGMNTSGTKDGYVMKLDATGAVAWTQRVGTTGPDEALAITLDAQDNLYVAGSTYGALEGTNPLGGRETFVAKYTAGGSQQWARQLNLGSYNAPTSITVDHDGKITVGGWWPQDGTEQGGSAYISQYTNDGEAIQTRLVTGSYSRTMALVNDRSGALYVGGTTDHGVNGQPFSGPVDSFLVKYGAVIGIAHHADASRSLTQLDEMIDTVNRLRSDLGAYVNRMTHAIDNATNMSQNLGASRSTIMDANYATETVSMAKSQILQQAATAVLAQANQRPQDVLKLLNPS